MRFKEYKLNKILESEKLVKKVLNIVKEQYRPYDPGNYLYNLLLDLKKDIFSDEYLKLVYTTLIAWNMNSRGASLESFENFEKSIRKNKRNIKKLSQYSFNDFNSNFDAIFKIITKLYNNLKLSKTKSKLVTFTKTLHFLIPNLMVPVDRKYTLNFFYNNTQMNTNKQLIYLKEIIRGFLQIYNKYELKKYIDNTWNCNLPKILDNIVIGYGIYKNIK